MHEGVKLNKKANCLARKATEEGTTIPTYKPKLPHLKAIAYQEVRKDIPQNNHLKYTSAGQFTKEINKALPGNYIRTLYNNLTYKEASILVQLQTGKSCLNKYLTTINVINLETCSYSREPETVQHFLFHYTN